MLEALVRQAIREAVRLALADELPKHLPEPLPTLLNRAQLAEQLGISQSSVNSLLHEGLPFVLVGQSKRYVLSDVLAWLRRTTAEKAKAGSPL